MTKQADPDNQRQDSQDLSPHELVQLRSWLTTTPEQRLAWLEEALIIAHQSGALPKRM